MLKISAYSLVTFLHPSLTYTSVLCVFTSQGHKMDEENSAQAFYVPVGSLKNNQNKMLATKNCCV